MMLEERRVRRMEEPHLALGLFLSSFRERTGAHAVSVGTGGGGLVAGSGEGAHLLAVVGERALAGERSLDALAVRRVDVGDDCYILASFCKPLDEDAATGVHRILSL